MKAVYPHFVLFVLSLLVWPCCTKKSSNQVPTCNIVMIRLSEPGDTSTVNLTYNDNGQLSTEHIKNSTSTTNKIFTYNGNTELVSSLTSFSGAGFVDTATDSITLTTDGLMLSDLFTDQVAQNVFVRNLTTYTYSGDQVLKSVVQPIPPSASSPPVTTVYSFTNGNLTTWTSGSSTTTVTYDNNKFAQQGDYFQTYQLLNTGGPFIKNKNLVTGYTTTAAGKTIIYNFSYDFDNTGKITTLVGTSGSTDETINDQYQCK